MPAKKTLFRFCLALFVASLSLGVSTARADQLFVGSSAAGLCCFNVDLHQVNVNDMQVTVTLTAGAQYFVDTGNGSNHPGFAFNLKGDPSIAASAITFPALSAWSSGDVHVTSDTTNGPSLGTFDYFIDNPGPGASKHNSGPLVFDIALSGITFDSFVANASGYYFEADIMDIKGNTGLSGINTIGSPTTTSNPPAVPEPSSLVLLGSGVLGLAGAARRKFRA